jgi:predicted lipid carrier protein YhbT
VYIVSSQESLLFRLRFQACSLSEANEVVNLRRTLPRPLNHRGLEHLLQSQMSEKQTVSQVAFLQQRFGRIEIFL